MFLYALLEKDDVVSALSVACGDRLSQVRNYCGRSNTMFYSEATPDRQAAVNQFHESMALSVDRGWKVIYYGPPKMG